MRLGFLQSVYEQQGPFATVYLDTSGDAEDAGKAIQLRWRQARERLAQRGADEKLLRAVDEELEQPQSRSGQRGEVILLQRTQPGQPPPQQAPPICLQIHSGFTQLHGHPRGLLSL